jgi:hypothetical protein
MTTRWGRNVTIDQDHPEALGICDVSGQLYMRKDLVRQMVWRGESLVWTGFYVGKDQLDVPNEQARNPVLPPDPIPITDPRIRQNEILYFNSSNLPPFNQMTISFNALANTIDGYVVQNQQSLLQQLSMGYFMGQGA